MKYESPETLHDIIQELLNRCRFGDAQRQRYEERIARAVWLDRAEAIQAAEKGKRKQ